MIVLQTQDLLCLNVDAFAERNDSAAEGRPERHKSEQTKSHAACVALLVSVPALSLNLNPLPGDTPRDFILKVAGRVVEIQLERSGLRSAVVTQMNRLIQADGP